MSSADPLTSSDAERMASSTYLDIMTSLTREYAVANDIDAVHITALEKISDAMQVEGASLFLLEKNDTELVCHACIGQVDVTGMRIPADAGIVGRSVQNNAPELVADVSQDPDFYSNVDQQSGFITRSILSAPLNIRDHKLGAICVVNPRQPDRMLNTRDSELLQSLASAAALAMSNAEMTRSLLERERVRQELVLASSVQKSLLPDCASLPENLCGLSRSAREMSGDFFDVVTLPDGKQYFAIADVSGKGLNAALLMVKTTSLFRLLAKSSPQPGKLLATINHELCANITAGMFVTMTAGIYDPETGHVCICNAGHMPTLLRSKSGRYREMSAAMPPLGIMCVTADDRYPEDNIPLCGSALYLYTDGVTEGHTADGEELGLEGMCAALDELSDENLPARLALLADRLCDENNAMHDDVTLLGVESIGAAKAAFPLSFCVTALPDRLVVIRDLLTAALSESGIDEDTRASIVLAVDEACQNIIRHAYKDVTEGEIEGHISLNSDSEGTLLHIALTDHAPEVPESACEPGERDELTPGGLGTHFMNDLMDEVYFDKESSDMQNHRGNRLIMVKRILHTGSGHDLPRRNQ